MSSEILRHEVYKELGYSKEERDQNIARMAFVASELTKAGVCKSTTTNSRQQQFVAQFLPLMKQEKAPKR